MKTVLITGAAGDLGFALCQAFSSGGWKILLHSRHAPSFVPQGSCFVSGDLASPCTITNLADAALKMGVSILINNAGRYACQPFPRFSEDEIKDIFHSNLLAPILLTKALLPCFRRLGGGIVFNIGSLSAVHPGKGESIYGATKAGLANFTRAMQWESPELNVDFIDVQIGAMRSRMTQERKDHGLLIDPYEVASVLWQTAESSFHAMKSPLMVFARRCYA